MKALCLGGGNLLRDWAHTDMLIAFRFMPAAGSSAEFYLKPQSSAPRFKSVYSGALLLAVLFAF